MTEPRWIPALKLDELPIGETRVISHGRQRIALFRPESEQLYAIDNRCPHEGYPLARGPVRECVVTCPWHNFKFDLRDGQCVLGDEQVRVYAIRLRDNTVEIDVREADASSLRPRHLASLESATREGKLGQIARELVRLLELGMSPRELALQAMRQDAAYAEYGTTHATPTAIDALHFARRTPGTQAALPLVQAFAIAAEANLRLPKRALADPVDPGDDVHAAGKRLRRLVEQEALPEAEALLRGALARGFGVDIIEPWLLQLCADHLLSFGHPLIYTVKICDFLRGADWQFAGELLPALLGTIINSTRMELVPEERWFRERLAEIEPELDSFAAACKRPNPPPIDRQALAAEILDGPRDAWVTHLRTALKSGVDLMSIVDALVLAASERLLRFDVSIDRDPTVQEGWLHITHRVTFASAIRGALAKPHPANLLRLLFQSAHFTHSAAPLDLSPTDRIIRNARTGDVATADTNGEVENLVRAIRRHDGVTAVGLTERLFADIQGHPGGTTKDVSTRPVTGADASNAGATTAQNPVQNAPCIASSSPHNATPGSLNTDLWDPLEAALETLTLDDIAIRPIFKAHWIKLCTAAFAEARALPPGVDRQLPILACVRFFAGPQRELRLRGLVYDAIRFVVDGKVPKTLT